ncbi:molybdopterin-guanine dinucleotide biosynthesis protein B [Sporosarcina sp. G11-34]|uniref:molybdopterin-guanine dinucleotide biosynthesis protein B n=1 Tax=Sporosarcina sp. G11-34 TaxID=2849605 RepID=UPI0022A9E1C6|nr:molybdopterin-guanine dinucleotide biosynthesis protein B [Sporosarcina sp. G11-34]
MKTLHVVGFKNSGKTTLIANWVRLLKERGLTVAVLKHHGHASPLELPNSDTDTMQFFESGADVSVVAGGGAVQFHMNEEPEFMRMTDIATLGKPDVLLIEGYKEEQGEKVLLLSHEEDWDELQDLQGVQLVVGNVAEAVRYPKIDSRSNVAELNQWFLNWINN